MKPALILSATILLTIALTASFNSQSTDSSTNGLVCKGSPRECLDYMLNTYLKALLVHKPEALPVAENIRFTENSADRKLGEGLWQTITKFDMTLGTKQEYIDVPQGIAALHMVAMDGTSPVFFILRIKVVDRKITEAETHLIRSNPDGSRLDFNELNAFGWPMNLAPMPQQLNSREELSRISSQFLEAQKSGTVNAADSAIAADAYRIERGPKSEFTYRIEAIDEDLGLVWIRKDFANRLVWEGFKIYDGRIHATEGFSGT